MKSMEEKVFDAEQSLRRLDGNEQLYEDLVRFFLEDSPALLDQLRVAGSKADYRGMEVVAHNVKNLAGNFNAQRTVRAAQELEHTVMTRQASQAIEACDRLDREIRRLQEALRAAPQIHSPHR